MAEYHFTNKARDRLLGKNFLKEIGGPMNIVNNLGDIIVGVIVFIACFVVLVVLDPFINKYMK